MNAKTRTVLKGYFATGSYPTASQIADLIDSFFHKLEDAIEAGDINGLQALLDGKVDTVTIDAITEAYNCDGYDDVNNALNEMREKINTIALALKAV